ncbi:MAG: GlsB/YeaQ/YmgE family stress response membrane protein [Erythrobacter sp.]|jgi:uncharacterized membrane protein YeaQ/YmgE (transglycosylase-associated protein family)
MGLLILAALGAVLGWLAAIVLRIEDGRPILSHMIAGIAGSLLAGLFIGNASIVGGVSAMVLLWAVPGAVVAIAGFTLLRQRLAG